MYFCDVGLAAWLVGINRREYLAAHPLRDSLFENLAVLEVLKTLHNAGTRPDLHFYRDSAGNEADLVLEEGGKLALIEIKAARSVAPDAMRAAGNIRRALGARVGRCALVYAGPEAQQRTDFDVVPVAKISRWVTRAARAPRKAG
jgi:predicted AAA+ superfamily ATPase